jgi:hypothetical protein
VIEPERSRQRYHSVCTTVGVVLLASMLAGCDMPLNSDRIHASGTWALFMGLVGGEFQLELEEAPDGALSGRWSYPGQFANYAIRGRREGLRLTLNADSHNLFPVLFQVDLVHRDRMEGYVYFEGEQRTVTLRRGSYWP